MKEIKASIINAKVQGTKEGAATVYAVAKTWGKNPRFLHIVLKKDAGLQLASVKRGDNITAVGFFAKGGSFISESAEKLSA